MASHLFLYKYLNLINLLILVSIIPNITHWFTHVMSTLLSLGAFLKLLFTSIFLSLLVATTSLNLSKTMQLSFYIVAINLFLWLQFCMFMGSLLNYVLLKLTPPTLLYIPVSFYYFPCQSYFFAFPLLFSTHYNSFFVTSWESLLNYCS